MEQKEKNQSLYNNLFTHYSRTIENRKNIKNQDLKKKQMILKRMELIDERVKDIQRKNEVELIKKREEERLKLYEKNLSIERKKRQTQYNNIQKIEKLNEKDKKMEDIKNEKMMIEQHKAEIAIEIEKQKYEILNKFGKLMEKKSEINPELIKKVFPEDDLLYEKVVSLREKQIRGEKKIQQKFGFYGTFQNNKTSLKKQYKIMNTNSFKKENDFFDNKKTKINSINSTIREEKSKNENNSLYNMNNNEDNKKKKMKKKESKRKKRK